MFEQDASDDTKESQDFVVEAWENNIERIERNAKIMREGAKAVEIYKNLGLIATEGYNIRRIDKIP
jgi:hypothetical protein